MKCCVCTGESLCNSLCYFLCHVSSKMCCLHHVARWSHFGWDSVPAASRSVCVWIRFHPPRDPSSLPRHGILNVRWLLPSMALSSLSASPPRRSHSSCVPERSARLISARLCVSCRVPPKASLAPLAQAAVRFQTARADGCLPNQSVLLSLISSFQTSIYFSPGLPGPKLCRINF